MLLHDQETRKEAKNLKLIVDPDRIHGKLLVGTVKGHTLKIQISYFSGSDGRLRVSSTFQGTLDGISLEKGDAERLALRYYPIIEHDLELVKEDLLEVERYKREGSVDERHAREQERKRQEQEYIEQQKQEQLKRERAKSEAYQKAQEGLDDIFGPSNKDK